jgi:hypothetical protein
MAVPAFEITFNFSTATNIRFLNLFPVIDGVMDLTTGSFTIDIPIDPDVWQRAIDQAAARAKDANHEVMEDIVTNAKGIDTYRKAALRPADDRAPQSDRHLSINKLSTVPSSSLTIPVSSERFLKQSGTKDIHPISDGLPLREDGPSYVLNNVDLGLPGQVSAEDSTDSMPLKEGRGRKVAQYHVEQRRRRTSASRGKNGRAVALRKYTSKRRLPSPHGLALVPAGVQQDVSHGP